MPEVEVATTARLPVETIWEFVREMDNWAPFLTGYQSHRKEDERNSRWVLKGDVGVLTRTLELRVRVTEWAGPQRVAFELEGLNEPLRGDGEFRMERERGPGDAAATLAPPRGRWLRLVERVYRALFRLFHARALRAAGADARARPGEGLATLHFRLRLEPGGPMAPMLAALIKPALRPAAEDLASRIVAHLEARSPRP